MSTQRAEGSPSDSDRDSDRDSSSNTDADTDPGKKADQLEQEIVAVRDNLGSLVSELDQRRHRALDVPLQIREHARPLMWAALALTGVVVGGLMWRHSRRRAQLDAESRLAMVRDKLLHAVGMNRSGRTGRSSSRKNDPADKSSIATRILVAAAVGGASILGKRLALALVNRAPTPDSTMRAGR